MEARNLLRLPIILLLLAVSGANAETPARIQADYDVLKGGIKVATISETYRRSGNNYQIESVTRSAGLLSLFKPEVITVTSTGTVTERGLKPRTFVQHRKLDSERNTRADLDWESGRATLTNRNGVRTVPLPEGTQDRLSAMYQFLFLPLQGLTALDFYMTNGNKLDSYSYRISHDQSETVPLGTIKARYVSSLPVAGENLTEIWLASEHDNFPYKLVITDPDGGKLTQVITRYSK